MTIFLNKVIKFEIYNCSKEEQEPLEKQTQIVKNIYIY